MAAQKLSAIQRAKQAAKAGYSISESMTMPGLFFIQKPDGTVYEVDTADASGPCTPVCNCQATVPCCKHVALVAICAAYVATMARQAAAPRPIRARRTFSARRIARMRALAPSFAPAKPAKRTPVPMTPEEIARAERVAKMLIADFGPAA